MPDDGRAQGVCGGEWQCWIAQNELIMPSKKQAAIPANLVLGLCGCYDVRVS